MFVDVLSLVHSCIRVDVCFDILYLYYILKQMNATRMNIFFAWQRNMLPYSRLAPLFLRPGAGDEERRAWSCKGNGVATDLDFLRPSTSLYFALQWDCFLSFVEKVEPAVPFGHWLFTRNGLTCFYHLLLCEFFFHFSYLCLRSVFDVLCSPGAGCDMLSVSLPAMSASHWLVQVMGCIYWMFWFCVNCAHGRLACFESFDFHCVLEPVWVCCLFACFWAWILMPRLLCNIIPEMCALLLPKALTFVFNINVYVAISVIIKLLAKLSWPVTLDSSHSWHKNQC